MAIVTKICARCGESTKATIVSMFNTDEICPECKREERGAPNYVKAQMVELDEIVRKGNHNFSGIGLSPADEWYLREQREKRERSKT